MTHTKSPLETEFNNAMNKAGLTVHEIWQMYKLLSVRQIQAIIHARNNAFQQGMITQNTLTTISQEIQNENLA